jgi:hypothetical protein
MRNFSNNICREIQNTHFMFNNFFPENCTVYEIMCKTYGRGGQDTGDNIIRHVRFLCWITKARNANSEYVMLVAFPRQQLLRERASVLCYMYITCLVKGWSTVTQDNSVIHRTFSTQYIHNYVKLACNIYRLFICHVR